MTGRRLMLALAATATLAALMGMHGLPLLAGSDASTTAAPVVHATGNLMAEHEHRAATPMAPDGASAGDDGSEHSHSLAHLCLAVLLGALTALVLALRRRPTVDALVDRSTTPPRRLVPRAIGPPTLAELCLLRC